MIQQLVKARAEYESKLKEMGDGAAKGLAEMLTEHIPEGHYLSWHQYTPYFNDGDACTFRLGDLHVIPDSSEAEPYAENCEGVRYVDSERFPDLCRVWGEIPEDLLESAFGNHVWIVIRKNGTHEVSDFDHD